MNNSPQTLTSNSFNCARYYSSDLSVWLSVDPLSDKYPHVSSYCYVENNPIMRIDPDGRDWYQVLTSEGMHDKNSQPIFFEGSGHREGYINIGSSVLSIDPSGNQRSYNADGSITNSRLLPEVTVGGGNAKGQGGVVVDNSWQATKHYLFGDGSPARIGPNTTNSLLNSPQFLKAHRGIINGQSNQSGKFTVDMTKRVFHIGRTNVSYSIAPGGHSVTYKLYDGDGFWDPDFIDEKYLGPSSPYFRPDGPDPNLERLGGTPYYYIPTIITFPF